MGTTINPAISEHRIFAAQIYCTVKPTKGLQGCTVCVRACGKAVFSGLSLKTHQSKAEEMVRSLHHAR